MHCDTCKRALSPSDAVAIWRTVRQGLGVGYPMMRGCMECAQDAMQETAEATPLTLSSAMRALRGESSHYRPAQCVGCGRRMVVATATKYKGPYRRSIYCSEDCKAETYARRQQKQRVCVECGEMFMTTRSHARTCSNACRQKLYRRRSDD